MVIEPDGTRWSTLRHVAILGLAICAITWLPSPARAEYQNDAIGFTPAHVFEGSGDGENIDVLTGNHTLTVPIGPRYRLSSDFNYGVTLYYNSKVWQHDCKNIPSYENCLGTVVAPDTYGLGWTLNFGRIHRDSADNGWSYQYQTPDGADHYFCTNYSATPPTGEPSCQDHRTVDGSRIKVEYVSNRWEAYPGDGTRVILNQLIGSSTGIPIGGWYATRVESVATPSVGIDITYDTTSAMIDRITDSAGRTIEFTKTTGSPGDVQIDFPAFGGGTASYTLRRLGSQQFQDPNMDAYHPVYRSVLWKIEFPPPLSSSTETYAFCYKRTDCPGQSTNPTGEPSFGYLLGRTLPTGAQYFYFYGVYASSKKRPWHAELRFKDLFSEGQYYRWSWNRFREQSPSDPMDPVPESAQYSASNPYQVRVLDPFKNLTVYTFDRTIYRTIGATDCWEDECPNSPEDGQLRQVDQYFGGHEDSLNLLRRINKTWDFDRNGSAGRMFQFRTPSVIGGAFKVVYNPRTVDEVTFTPPRLDEPGINQRTAYANWVGGNRPTETTTYDDSGVYRTVFRNYTGDYVNHDTHDLEELRRADGSVVSRTDRRYVSGRLMCEVRRKTATGQTLTDCTDVALALQSGDVATINTYASGNLTQAVTKGGDDGGSFTTTFTYAGGGYLATKSFGLGWLATDRTIDAGSGLVASSRDPAGTQITYTWDALGRLTAITPTAPEVPTTIQYPSLRETRVRQEFSGSNFLESIYTYDDRGRLVQTKRRTVDGTYEMQKTEYDVLNRVTRRSEWVAETAPPASIPWTTYDFTAFEDPNPLPGYPATYPDPLGRVHAIVTPDDTTPQTPTIEKQYGPLKTKVIVRDIRGGQPGTNNWLTATTTYTNDLLGRLVAVDSPGAGADAAYLYDEQDQLVEVRLTDPGAPTNAQIRRFVYDGLGRLRSASNPENGTVDYTSYDSRGNLGEYRDAAGSLFKDSYDAAGRLLFRRVNLGGSDLTLVSNTYDAAGAAGKLSQQGSYRVAGTGTALVSSVQFTYGGANAATACSLGPRGYGGLNGRLSYQTTTIQPWNTAVRTDFCQDELGRPYLLAYPDPPASGRTRSRVGHSFSNGLLWELHDAGRDIQYIKNVLYDPGAVPREIIRGNDVKDVITHDVRGRPAEISVQALQGQGTRPPLSTLGGCGGAFAVRPQDLMGCGGSSGGWATLWDPGLYVYDMAGNIQNIGGSQYYYDELSRLVAATVVPTVSSNPHDLYFSFDAFGNMLSQQRTPQGYDSEQRSYQVDWQSNRLISQAHSGAFGSETLGYSFDANGNLTREGQRAFVFDATNQLTSVTDPDRGILGSYDYDASGYRVRSDSDGVETFYLRDGSGQVLSEFRRPSTSTNPPAWDKDYIYAFGKAALLVKNDIPQVPRKPKASAVTGTSLTVSWPAVVETDLASYVIEKHYRATANGTENVFNTTVDASVTSTQDTYPAAGSGTRLRYVIRSKDAATNTSDGSPELVVLPAGPPPPVPTGVTGTPGDGTVQLQWTAITTTQDEDILGYDVEKRQGSGFDITWVLQNDDPIENPQYLMTGLVNGQAYVLRVKAVDTAGRRSDASTEITVTPRDTLAPSRPSDVAAEPTRAAGMIRVSWRGVVDPDASSYRIYRNTTNVLAGSSQVGSIGDGVQEWYEFTDAAPVGATYYYWVSTVDTSDNESDRVGPATARPRHTAIAASVLQSATYEVDPGPTVPGCAEDAGLATSGDSCELCAHDNDTIQVRVTWSASPDASSGYRVYRKAASEDSFQTVANVASGTTVLVDTSVPEGDYTYYVVAKKDIGGTVEESAASDPSAGGADHAVDDFPATTAVQNLSVVDGTYQYSTRNAASRWARVAWSRVPESKLVGYHVYRRCEWLDCERTFISNTSVPACENSWVRITRQPVSDALRFFEDRTLGGQNQCVSYAVRPVGPSGIEGPMTKLVNTEAIPGNTFDLHCYRDTYDWDPVSGVSAFTDEQLNGAGGINTRTKGTGSASGAPPPPSGLSVAWRQKQPHPGYSAWVLYAVISWTQASQASDLAGYFVEMAGSYSGPWQRLNTNPVAWWETRYTAQDLEMFRVQQTGPLDGGCRHFRVIAVDDEGNESQPAYPSGYPITNCPETPWAPLNLVATTEQPGGVNQSCTTRLTWDPPAAGSPTPAEYRIYRLSLEGGSPYTHWYRTQIQAASAGTTYVETSSDYRTNALSPSDDNVFCPYVRASNTYDCELDNLEAFFVTARGATGGESPRSNIAFWNCWNDPGYVRKLKPTAEFEDAIARLLENDGESAESEIACWAESATSRVEACEAPRAASRVDLRQSARAIDVASADRSTASSRSAVAGSVPTLAPLMTLGSAADPPWRLFDLHTDHLGSVRLITANDRSISSMHDYFPFGEEISQGPSYNTHEFTGHERDQTTGLDYMLARYHSSSLARFLSKDPKPGPLRFTVPQAWNAYLYTLNNPLKFLDPDGNDIVLAEGSSQGFTNRMTKAFAQASRNAETGGNFQNAENSSITVVVKEGRLPVQKTKEGHDIGIGKVETTKKDASGNPTEITVTIDTTNISNTWHTGNQSEAVTDVEAVAHEFAHVNNQLTPEGRAETNADPEAEEQKAKETGEETAEDPATQKKPTEEEKKKAGEMLKPRQP